MRKFSSFHPTEPISNVTLRSAVSFSFKSFRRFVLILKFLNLFLTKIGDQNKFRSNKLIFFGYFFWLYWLVSVESRKFKAFIDFVDWLVLLILFKHVFGSNCSYDISKRIRLLLFWLVVNWNGLLDPLHPHRIHRFSFLFSFYF